MCASAEHPIPQSHRELLNKKAPLPPSFPGSVFSDEDYRLVFENQDEGSVICELLYDDAGRPHDYRYIAVNPAFERRAGLAARQAIGKTRRELFPTATIEIERYAQAVNTGQSVQYEHYSVVTGRYMAVHVTSLGGRRFAVLASDIQERMQAMVTLSTGAMRYHNLAELMPGMLWAASPEGLSFDRNSRWEEYTGQTADQANGKGWIDIVHPDDVQRICERWALSVRTGSPYLEEARLRRASDRSYRWHTVQALLRQDDEGNPIGWFGTCVDIDDLKQTQEALRNSELQLRLTTERFETTLSHSAIALFMYDLDLRCTWSHSPNLGFHTEQSLGKRNIEFFEWAEDARAFDTMMQAVIDTGVSRRQDIQVHAKGVDHCFDVLIEPLLNAEGRIVGVSGTFVDVTERMQTRLALLDTAKQLQRTTERFKIALKSTPVVVFNQDLDLRYTWIYNFGLGYEREEQFIGKRDRELLERAADAEVTESIKQTVISSGMSRRQEIVVHSKGVELHFDLLVEPLRDADGRIEGVTCAAIDITERKHLEFRLREADRQKDDFLAMLGHELRNPLGAISNTIEILRRVGKDTTRLAWGCEVLARQSGQMTRLVDDLLDISRISQGKIELNRQPVRVANLAHQALETCRPMLEARRHQISLQLPTEPVWVKGDAARLIQVLCNLLNNAAKYTDEGGHVRLEVESSGSEVTLQVSDNGRGLPAEALPHLFDLFYQVDRTLDRNDSGLGIGLSLVKRLVELHGGSVRAYSAGVGKGSDFVIRLPRLPHAPSAEASH